MTSNENRAEITADVGSRLRGTAADLSVGRVELGCHADILEHALEVAGKASPALCSTHQNSTRTWLNHTIDCNLEPQTPS